MMQMNQRNKRSLLSLAPFDVRRAYAADAIPGLIRPDLRALGLLPPIMGGAPGGTPTGTHTQGDVIYQLADGTDPNDLWTELQQQLDIWNQSRQTIVDFLTYPVSNQVESVAQGTSVDFEPASEFGVPVGVRTGVSYFQMGYTLDWFDIATRYTWKFLLDADQRQVTAVHNNILEADNRLIFTKVMNALFRNTNRVATIKGQNYNVYALYNNDGTVPPTYKTNTFTGSHTHYRTSGAAGIDSGDVEELIDDLRSHGYGENEGSALVFMVNKAQGDVIRTWRFGVTNANAAVAKYDFIPAQGTSPLIIPNALQGAGLLGGGQPPSSIDGLTVIGSYGPALIVQEDYIPAGYVLGFATGGSANLSNPVGLREHANPAARGLQLVQGPIAQYPLQESYYRRGFGTGIRQRGAAIVMQITAGAYAIPAVYA
jgi:hypothetical protein